MSNTVDRHVAILTSVLSLALAACSSEPVQSTEPTSVAMSSAVAAAPASAPASAAASSVASSRPVAGPAAVPIDVPPALAAIVDAADRSADDKALDAGRHPGEMLAFFGVAPEMKVAEIGAGGGYTAELLSRAVGAKGVVYGENSKFILDKFAEKPWSARLAKPVMKNVVRADRPFDDPLPPEAKNLDEVFLVLFYHDTVWMKVDRAKMNAAIFKALKPGGVYAIVDHSGRDGTGSTETDTFHRIEESVVKDEVTSAGFKLDSEGFFLRNPSDTRDWNDSPKAAGERRGTSDRFVLKFVKP